MKKCNKCKVEKDFTHFYKRKNRGEGNAGYFHICRKCVKKTDKEYIKGNGIFNKKEYNKKYRIKNADALNQYLKDYRNDNSEILREKRKIYYQKNKEYIKERNYDYCKKKRVTDPLYKLSRGIRSLILRSFKSKFTTKSKKTIEILGCSFDEFKMYLESKFDDKMNWDNQGTYWHMDHIIPISSAETEEDVYRLNHYTNFQPLYWEDNLKKSNKIYE